MPWILTIVGATIESQVANDGDKTTMLILPWTKCQEKHGEDTIESEITIIVPHELHKQTSVLIAIGAIQKLMRRVGCESYDIIDEHIDQDYRIYTYTVSHDQKFQKEIMRDLSEQDHFHYEMMIIEE